MPKVSIIVPVYKAEKYLHKCVNSIIKQTYRDWELLLIDDGSPDSSGTICDEFANLDSRIRVYHKCNGGVSSARNVGISIASGEFLTFLDSDDWLDLETLDKCSPYFQEYDVIRFGIINYFSSTCWIDQNIDVSLSKISFLNRIVARDVMLGVCSGIFRKSLFDDYNIYFDESISMGEDWQVLIKTVLHSKSIKLLPYNLYFYNRQNEGSCVNTDNFDKSIQCLNVLDWINSNETLKRNISKESIDRCKCNLSYHFLCVIKSTCLGVGEYETIKRESYPSIVSIVKYVCDIKKVVILLLCYTKIGFCLWNKI